MRLPWFIMFLAVCIVVVPCVGQSGETCLDYTSTAPLVDFQRFDSVHSPVSLGDLVVFLVRDDEAWSLRTVDAGSPSPLSVLGELAFARPQKMWASGGYVYVLEDQALVIVDIGNPADPFVVARLAGVGEVQGLQVHGDHLYVANHWQSLQVYDISTIEQPQLVNEMVVDRDYVYEVLVRQGLLVVRLSTQLAVYGLDDPASPSLLTTLPLPGWTQSMISYEDYVLVGVTGSGLAVIDFADPIHPILTRFVETGIAHHISPRVLGNRLLVGDQEEGLQVLGLGNLPQIDQLATITIADGPWQIAVAAGLAVVNNRNKALQLLDVDSYESRDPVVASSELPNRMWNLRTKGNLIYGIHSLYPPRGFFVLELDQMGGLSSVGSWSGPEIMHFEIADDLAVLAEGVKLRFLDISNPASPTQVGEVLLFGGEKQIAIDGHYAYVFHTSRATANSTGNFITVVDFADPGAPSIVGTSPDLGSRMYRLHVHKGIVYAASGETGLSVYMMGRGRAGNKPTLQFKHLTTVALPGWPAISDLQFKDKMAYVVSSDALNIVDCSNPRKAHLVSTFYMPLSSSVGWGLVLADEHAYMNAGKGVLALNISDLSQPELVGYLETGQRSFGLVECGGYLVSTTVEGLGLSMYQQCGAADERPLPGRNLTALKLESSDNAAGLQNIYPVPANPSVTFKYDLGTTPSGDISIYDLRGHRLYEAHLSTAVGELQWHGTDQAGRGVATGVYFVKLRWGQQEQVNRFSLVR